MPASRLLKHDPNNVPARERLARLFAEHLDQPDLGDRASDAAAGDARPTGQAGGRSGWASSQRGTSGICMTRRGPQGARTPHPRIPPQPPGLRRPPPPSVVGRQLQKVGLAVPCEGAIVAPPSSLFVLPICQPEATASSPQPSSTEEERETASRPRRPGARLRFSLRWRPTLSRIYAAGRSVPPLTLPFPEGEGGPLTARGKGHDP